MNSIGFEAIAAYESELLSYATEKLEQLGGVEFIGQAAQKASVLSFNLKGIHPYDVGSILDKLGVAVRTGHHCAQPVMAHFKVPGTVRASFAFYNTKQEIDIFVEAVKTAQRMLS
jgi:cysteine desulfurase/selenocysteine lyase